MPPSPSLCLRKNFLISRDGSLWSGLIIELLLASSCRGIPSFISVFFPYCSRAESECGIPTLSVCVWEDGYIKASSPVAFTVCIMEKQQVALEERLMGKRMTPGALEATGGSSRSKQRFKLALALVAVMGLLIVVLLTAFIYCFLQVGKKIIICNTKNTVGAFPSSCSCINTGSTCLFLWLPAIRHRELHLRGILEH